MGTSDLHHRVDRDPKLDIDIPAAREYDTSAAAELDRRLCDAIEAARAADNTFLARTLSYELGSHYWDAR
jgi:hypothetical protein